MTKDKTRLIFLESKNNLFYSRIRVVQENAVANYTTEPVKQTTTVIIGGIEDSTDECNMSEHVTRVYASDSYNDNKDKAQTKKPVDKEISKAATKTKPTYASIIIESGAMIVIKIDQHINSAHHKWGHHGKIRLQGVAKAKCIRLVGKLKCCDACGAVKVKVTHIPKSTSSDKEAKYVGERLFIDITGPFPLIATKWNKDVHNKLCWYEILDQCSGKVLA